MRQEFANEQFVLKSEDSQQNGDRRIRFDSSAFYSALDAERRSRKSTWKRVAEEAQVSASTLSRMAQGRRPDIDSMAALVAWSGLSADTFVLNVATKPAPGSLSVISTCLKSDPQLSPEAASALDELLKVMYERMRGSG